jgi:hypothetical protein
MTKPISVAACLAIGLLLCMALASLLLADEAIATFRITSHSPSSHEVGVDLDAAIYAAFDDDANAATLNNGTFVVHGHLGGLAPGTFSYDAGSHSVRLIPDRAFHPGEVLRVSATAGISSSGGTPLTPYGWQFTAGPVVARDVAGFVDVGVTLTGVSLGSVSWGDYDNDADLDILLTGVTGPNEMVSKVYRNDAPSGFTDIGAGLTGVRRSSAAWGDYDNDGDLDILVAGIDSTYNQRSSVYRNDGGGVFSDIGAALIDVHWGCVAWGDYDNDGDLDILLTGLDRYGDPHSKVYRNDAPSGFTEIGASLTPVTRSTVAWGDYDNDGDLDILLAGSTTAYPSCDAVSKVYRNDGGGAFTDIDAGLAQVCEGAVAWGDYDKDGDLDILLTGSDSADNPVSRVYRNDGSGAFGDIFAELTAVTNSSVAWGDYDNDGDLDILLTGWTGVARVSRVYRNDGGGSFTEIAAGLTGVMGSSVAWGDYDNDGDLDILLTGKDSAANHVSLVYRNNSKPSLEGVVPDDGSAPAASKVTFATTWSDPDGSADLKQCYFHIGENPALAGNVTLLYNARKDKLWMLDDSGTGWIGGHAPESANVIDNSQARVYCADTTVRHGGDSVEVVWAIRFQSGFAGYKRLGLKARDIYKAKAKAAWKGRWEILP